MQCPSCGFENMPGPENCVMCNHELSAKPPEGRLSPPRARDHSFMEKIGWGITHSPTWIGADRIASNIGRGQISRITMPWMGLREVLWSIASAIPGIGHLCVMHRRLTGLSLLLGSFIALAGAVILYKSIAADWLLYSIAITSAFSMWSVVRWFRGNGYAEDVKLISDFGIALMITALYLGSYALLRFTVSSTAVIVKTIGRPDFPGITANDDLLVYNNHKLKRGDVIIADAQQGASGPILGQVVGMPGDQVVVQDRVYINGSPTRYVYHIPGGDHVEAVPAGTNISVTLGADEYWIPPMLGSQFGREQDWLSNGIVSGSSSWGKVVAVTGPPAHRHLLD